MSGSKSLDSFRPLEVELRTFNCQDDSEEIFEETTCDTISVDVDSVDGLDINEKNEARKSIINYGAVRKKAEKLLKNPILPLEKWDGLTSKQDGLFEFRTHTFEKTCN